MLNRKLLQEVLNAVYAGALKECEEAEHRAVPKVMINGHHMAQRIVQNVQDELVRRKLFDVPG